MYKTTIHTLALLPPCWRQSVYLFDFQNSHLFLLWWWCLIKGVSAKVWKKKLKNRQIHQKIEFTIFQHTLPPPPKCIASLCVFSPLALFHALLMKNLKNVCILLCALCSMLGVPLLPQSLHLTFQLFVFSNSSIFEHLTLYRCYVHGLAQGLWFCRPMHNFQSFFLLIHVNLYNTSCRFYNCKSFILNKHFGLFII